MTNSSCLQGMRTRPQLNQEMQRITVNKLFNLQQLLVARAKSLEQERKSFNMPIFIRTYQQHYIYARECTFWQLCSYFKLHTSTTWAPLVLCSIHGHQLSSLTLRSFLDPPQYASLPSFLVSKYIFKCSILRWFHPSAKLFILALLFFPSPSSLALNSLMLAAAISLHYVCFDLCTQSLNVLYLKIKHVD